jgi:hypothetical protein
MDLLGVPTQLGMAEYRNGRTELRYRIRYRSHRNHAGPALHAAALFRLAADFTRLALVTDHRIGSRTVPPAPGEAMPLQQARSVARAAFLACGVLAGTSCAPWAPPASLVGTWSRTQVVGVRVRQPRGPYRFVSDTVAITIGIRADGSVEGRVGGATLLGAYVLKNRGWFGRAMHIGTDFRLEGRLQGSIFAADPVPTMDIHAPFSLVGDTLAGTLFQQSGMGVFPMVELRLVKR